MVEGLTTAPVLRDLSHRLGIELPITEGVCRVLDGEDLDELSCELDGPPTDARMNRAVAALASHRSARGPRAARLAAAAAPATTSRLGASPARQLVAPGALALRRRSTATSSSSQWQQLDELAQKFPASDKALARIELALAKQGVDYENDVKPALGPEIDVAGRPRAPVPRRPRSSR